MNAGPDDDAGAALEMISRHHHAAIRIIYIEGGVLSLFTLHAAIWYERSASAAMMQQQRVTTRSGIDIDFSSRSRLARFIDPRLLSSVLPGCR